MDISIWSDVVKIKAAGFRDACYELLDSGWQCSCIYEQNSSVFVRFIRLGRDGFVKVHKVLRTYPMSSKAAYRLIVRL